MVLSVEAGVLGNFEIVVIVLMFAIVAVAFLFVLMIVSFPLFFHQWKEAMYSTQQDSGYMVRERWVKIIRIKLCHLMVWSYISLNIFW